MNPYYEHGGITIHHGDCRDILPQLGKFDLCLTDPPYSISLKNSYHGKKGKNLNLLRKTTKMLMIRTTLKTVISKCALGLLSLLKNL